MRLGLCFGAYREPLAKQIADQGFVCPAHDLEHFQVDADALTRARCRGLITPSQCAAAERKLMKNICKVTYKANENEEQGA